MRRLGVSLGVVAVLSLGMWCSSANAGGRGVHAARGAWHAGRTWRGGYGHGWGRGWYGRAGWYGGRWWPGYGFWLAPDYCVYPPVAYPAPGYGIASMVLNIVSAALARPPAFPPVVDGPVIAPGASLPAPTPLEPPSADTPPPVPPQESTPPSARPSNTTQGAAAAASKGTDKQTTVRHPVIRRLARRLIDRVLSDPDLFHPPAAPTPPDRTAKGEPPQKP